MNKLDKSRHPVMTLLSEYEIMGMYNIILCILRLYIRYTIGTYILYSINKGLGM